MKSYAEYLTLLSEQRDDALCEHDAALLAGAMLDGGVPDVELGALVVAMRAQPDPALLLDGLLSALDNRVNRWPASAERAVPIVLGCYGGATELPNLTPLLGLMLARFGIPVLMHGPLHAEAGVSTALVLRELGIMPCAQKQHVTRELADKHIAFAPDALLAPGLAGLLALRPRLGALPMLITAARLIDPFDGGALVVAAADSPEEMALMRSAVGRKGMRALILQGSEGEAFASPAKRPRMEHWLSGEVNVLFDEDAVTPRRAVPLPGAADAKATAVWIREACEGVRAVPAPLVNQLAACLHAADYCDDFNQAKALAAIAAAGRRVA
jgi:anthranilate phosphoribosyltransferase